MKLKRLSLAALMLAAAGCGANTTNDSVIGSGTADSDGGNATGGETGSPGTGGSDGTSSGNGNSDGNCKEYVVRNEQVTPDMMIVLDRSGSMRSGSTNRWDPSVNGLKDITSQLDSAINFGLMVFPAEDSCGPGSIEVPVGPNKAAEIASVLDMTQPNGGTPTSQSLAAAHAALGSGAAAPDQLPRPKLILLVTDGSPNCVNVGNNCVPGGFDLAAIQAYSACLTAAAAMTDGAAIRASVEEIVKMVDDGIKTYVIGYDTKSGAIATAMDQMAAAGGTGDTQHRAVEDAASLVAAFREIAGKAVSCTFVLEEEPKDPSYVQVSVDGNQLNLNQPDGWSLGPDGKTVEVMGAACALLQGGGQHTLDVQIKCDVVPII